MVHISSHLKESIMRNSGLSHRPVVRGPPWRTTSADHGRKGRLQVGREGKRVTATVACLCARPMCWSRAPSLRGRDLSDNSLVSVGPNSVFAIDKYRSTRHHVGEFEGRFAWASSRPCRQMSSRSESMKIRRPPPSWRCAHEFVVRGEGVRPRRPPRAEPARSDAPRRGRDPGFCRGGLRRCAGASHPRRPRVVRGDSRSDGPRGVDRGSLRRRREGPRPGLFGQPGEGRRQHRNGQASPDEVARTFVGTIQALPAPGVSCSTSARAGTSSRPPRAPSWRRFSRSSSAARRPTSW